jgi:hypothetical protein
VETSVTCVGTRGGFGGLIDKGQVINGSGWGGIKGKSCWAWL